MSQTSWLPLTNVRIERLHRRPGQSFTGLRKTGSTTRTQRIRFITQRCCRIPLYGIKTPPAAARRWLGLLPLLACPPGPIPLAARGLAAVLARAGPTGARGHRPSAPSAWCTHRDDRSPVSAYRLRHGRSGRWPPARVDRAEAPTARFEEMAVPRHGGTSSG